MKTLYCSGIIVCNLLLGGALAAQPLPKVQLRPAFPKLTLDHPLYMAEAPDGSGRMFTVEQIGRILVVPKDTDGSQSNEFLNIVDRHPFAAYEEGLLSIAFHPDFKRNGLCYIFYTVENTNDRTFHPSRSILSELKVSASDPNRADMKSERILLEMQQPFLNHKGGLLLFGPDGYLYVSTGDGGMGCDPYNNGQNCSSLLGKILRIDVNSRSSVKRGTNIIQLPYGIPRNNPYVNEPDMEGLGARREVFALGLRNPWRYSFDRQTGDLWAGDVGESLWEEVDLIVKGGNYGWDIREGLHRFKPGPPGAQYIDPVIEYPHKPELLKDAKFSRHGIGCAVIGGFVYRGQKYPSLQGVYLYADYALGTIFGLRYKDGKVTDYSTLLEQPKNITSFAEDSDGEIYVVAFDGHIYSVAATSATD